MTIKTKAIVLKHHFLSEEDKMLFLLSKDYGLIEAKARGIKRLKGSLLNSTEDCCCSDFCLFSGKRGYIVNSADKIDNFFSLRNDIEKMALASYFCELTYFLTPTAENAEVFLRLLCNFLYFLANDKRSPAFLKPVYELRAMSESGFTPNLVGCEACGIYEDDLMYFYPQQGVILCRRCMGQQDMVKQEQANFQLAPPVLAAMRHILFSEMNKLFQFKVNSETLRYLDSISEYYVKLYLERTLNTLEFYHSLIALPLYPQKGKSKTDDSYHK